MLELLKKTQNIDLNETYFDDELLSILNMINTQLIDCLVTKEHMYIDTTTEIDDIITQEIGYTKQAEDYLIRESAIEFADVKPTGATYSNHETLRHRQLSRLRFAFAHRT